MEDPVKKALDAQRRVSKIPDPAKDLRQAIEASKAVYEVPDAQKIIDEVLEASRGLYSIPDVQASLRQAIEASKAVDVYEAPDAQKIIDEVLEASRGLYSIPDVQASLRQAIEASKAVYEVPDFTDQLRKALGESAQAVRAAGERLQEKELVHDAESVPDPSDAAEIWGRFLGGLSPLGRLIVLNAFIGLLQVLLLQVESSSHADVPDTLKAGIVWSQAIINAIMALISAQKA